MNEKTNLSCTEAIAAVMKQLYPDKPYICYVAHKVPNGKEESIAVENPVIWKGATTIDMLSCFGAVLRTASLNAMQFIQNNFPEHEQEDAMQHVLSMATVDMSNIQRNVPKNE